MLPLSPAQRLTFVFGDKLKHGTEQGLVVRWRVMVHFSEDFVGGFFGFGRTYGASVRFECDSVAALEADWPAALAATASWRASRKDKATSLHLFFESTALWLWDAVSFVKANVIVSPGSLAQELHGLYLCVYVLTPDMEHYLYAELYPVATAKSAGSSATSDRGVS